MEQARIGVVGCGYWGPNLVRNFVEMPSAELVAVADLRDERVQHMRSRYSHVQVTHDFRDLFDMHLDGVVVTTPPSQHYAVASECLRRGLGVLVEKPMTLNSRDAEDLIRLAGEHDCALMVGHTFEYNSAVRALKDIMTRGDLGQIYYISTLRLNLGPVRPDYDVVWDLAPHDISILCYLLDSEPLAVGGSGASLLFGGVYDIAFLCLEFPQRVYAHVRLSWLDPCKVRQVTVVGSEKMAVYDDMSSNEKIKIYDQHVTGHTYTDTFGEFQLQYHHGDIVIPYIPFSEPLRAECEHFVRCIQTGAVPQSDGLSGLRVVRAIEAAEHSMHNGGGLEALSLNRGTRPMWTRDWPALVELAEPYEVDDGVLLGYLTGRHIEDVALVIGPYARIRSGTVVYAGSHIGARLQTGHGVVIREQNAIGDDLSIWNNSTIDYGCVIGSGVKIHCNVYIAQYTTIEDEVFLAPGVTIANDPHPLCTRCMCGPTIRCRARIGVNVTLMPRIIIGESALIGAGSVVTRDIPACAVAYGNPARVVKMVDELECPEGLVDRPYRDGRDVMSQARPGD